MLKEEPEVGGVRVYFRQAKERSDNPRVEEVELGGLDRLALPGCGVRWELKRKKGIEKDGEPLHDGLSRQLRVPGDIAVVNELRVGCCGSLEKAGECRQVPGESLCGNFLGKVAVDVGAKPLFRIRRRVVRWEQTGVQGAMKIKTVRFQFVPGEDVQAPIASSPTEKGYSRSLERPGA